jgi:hypothetical protein
VHGVVVRAPVVQLDCMQHLGQRGHYAVGAVAFMAASLIASLITSFYATSFYASLITLFYATSFYASLIASLIASRSLRFSP